MANQAKKVFTRLCLNNWGGVNHQILEFHEYVNLFSGKSGSGKSTVMDAIQVILYGSFSSAFLNKAADDAKNKRSVLSYLRGEQKDGSANRGNKDFCSTIALEIFDKGSKITTCVGATFEVRKSDGDLKRYYYFSHSGKMPEHGYLNDSGIPYTIQEMKTLIKERMDSPDNRGKSDVNRLYQSKESYLNVLYDRILGYIDGNRFITMEKSAIALRMTNGTGQFIRDYMFPKSTGDTILRISEQLGAYQGIKNQIEDLKHRIDGLTKIQEHNLVKVTLEADQIHARKVIQCIDIAYTKQRLKERKEQSKALETALETLYQEDARLKEERSAIETELIQVSADLKASDLGAKRHSLEELEKRGVMLANDDTQWNYLVKALRRWELDDMVTDYVSNPMLQRLATFCDGAVSAELCEQLRGDIEETKKEIELEYDRIHENCKEVSKKMQEKQKLVEDMKQDRKPYGEQLKKAKAALAGQLSLKYGKTIPVYVFADLFDIKEEGWKQAIEGRLGRLKTCLITEPKYAHEAAVIFRQMKQYQHIEFIHAKKVVESNPTTMENSLYDAVKTEFEYVDACLKRYLGRVIKCQDVTELEQVRDGVTKDCFAYSNFIFRHLNEKDYTTGACIGTKVSKAKLQEYEDELQLLQQSYQELCRMVEALKSARNLESLNQDANYLNQLAKAGKELEQVVVEKMRLQEEIKELQEGACRILEEREASLQVARTQIEKQCATSQQSMIQTATNKTQVDNDVQGYSRELEKHLLGYVVDEAIEAWVLSSEWKQFQGIKSQKEKEITNLEEQIQKEKEELQKARTHYIIAYPNCGFSGAERTNEVYEKQLETYQQDYEEKYLQEFEKQSNIVYRSLRDNVLATIHGDIKAAKRHTREINRLLRETNFSDSTYQIKIEPAKDNNGQFYEMLMADELDSKNIDNGGFEGQLSLGEELFHQKYEQKISLLLEKFMPTSAESLKEMERYSDYRNYLSFSMFEQVTDEQGQVIRENFVDEMAGKDSGGEGQNPKYVALLAGFAMLYMQQSNRDSKIKLVLLDEAFSKMDQERSAVCLKYARKMDLQLIVCVPDERLQSLVRNVDSIYGFRRFKNEIFMMHVDKGDYLNQLEGEIL